MRLVIKRDYAELSQYVARYVAQSINSFVPTTQKQFVLGLPTGSTPLGAYQHLVLLYKEGKVSFRDVVTFNMDEYCELESSHPQSYHTFMWENFFGHVDIAAHNVHIPDGCAPNIEEQCSEYESLLSSWGGATLFLGGLGVDGHLAFNEPFSSFGSRTREVQLTQETREVNSRFFGGDLHSVPSSAITIGLGTLMDSKEVLILVSGAAKAEALARGVEGPMTHLCPLSVLQMHPSATIVCDRDAASVLSKGTIEHFASSETEHSSTR